MYLQKDTKIFRYKDACNVICNSKKLEMIHKSIIRVKWIIAHTITEYCVSGNKNEVDHYLHIPYK